MNQSELEANTCYHRRTRENAYEPVTTGFDFAPIGWESGASFSRQSQSVAMQNQSNRKITFDAQLKTALLVEFW